MNEMTITSAQYMGFGEEPVCINAVIDDIPMSVPLDPANRHYAEIMRQVEVGELVIQDAETV